MIFAEFRVEGDEYGYHTLRWIVYNGDTVGTYGVHYNDERPYGATRDRHELATDKDMNDPSDYVNIVGVNPCEYHDDKLSVCDGSSLVEITDNDQRAFEIAAMMAGVRRGDTGA